MFIVHTCFHKQRGFQLSPCRAGSQFCSRWGFWPEKIRSHRQKKKEGNEWSATFQIHVRFLFFYFSHDSWHKTKQIGGSGFELDSDSNGSVKTDVGNGRQTWKKLRNFMSCKLDVFSRAW
jgi:hypothetical protein